MEQWFEVSRTIVMPAQCDLYGHLNVRHYAGMFDDAGFQMLAFAGISLSDLRGRGLGTVAATITIDFHREVAAGQLVLIKGAVTRVGAKSFSHELRLFEVDSMAHCATQRTVEVCFDTAARKGVPWPDDVGEKLRGLLAEA